jgi:hypothetical protein
MKRFKITLVALSLLASSTAFSSIAVECNETIRLKITEAAKAKCDGKFKNMFWSEKEVDVTADGQTVSAAFAFQCGKGKQYLGLVKSTLLDCKVSEPILSHASRVPSL